MKDRAVKILAVCGIAVLLGLDLVFFFADFSQSGIKLSSPLSRRVYGPHISIEGNAWLDHSLADFSVYIEAEAASGELIERNVPRDEAGGAPGKLNSFRTSIVLPSDGYWRIRAVLVNSAGEQVDRDEAVIRVKARALRQEFRFFTPGHALPVLTIILACLGVGLLFTGINGQRLKRRFEALVAVALWVNEFVYHLYWYASGGWTVASGLLIQMCGLSILLLIVVFALDDGKYQSMLFELIFFWGCGGALLAIITPDIGARGFPDYKYFSFFLSHGLILIGAVYIVVGRHYRPTWKSVVRIFVITNVLAAASYWFNRFLERVPPFQRGNYFLTGFPPPTGSIVDIFDQIFGPSPGYIIGLELAGIVVFVLLWLPFALGVGGNTARALWSDR